MKTHEFKNYEEYLTAQLGSTTEKAKFAWARPEELEAIASAIRTFVDRPSFGICHGVRTAYEVETLGNLLDCEVIGTDLKAVDDDRVVSWDFHDVNPDWRNRADFVYSNALDHSYRPEIALDAWLHSLTPRGVIVVHWSRDHNRSRFGRYQADCFQASKEEYRMILENVGVVLAEVPTFETGSRCVFIVRKKWTKTV